MVAAFSAFRAMSLAAPVTALLDRFQASRPVRAWSLIVTLYGDAIVPRGGSLWLGSLTGMMARFGIDAGHVRTATSRLVAELADQGIQRVGQLGGIDELGLVFIRDVKIEHGRGVMNFEPYLREIKALGIDGAVSIELEYSPEPDRIADWVREAYQATDRLLRAEGLRG